MTISRVAALALLLFSGVSVAGTLYTIDEEASPHGTLYTLDPLTGSATLAHEINTIDDLSASLLGGAYDSSRDILLFTTYFKPQSDAGLVQVNQYTGEGEWAGEIGGPENTSNVFGAAYDSTNNILYAADDDQSPPSLITVDVIFGQGTTVGPFGNGPEDLNIHGMAYDPATDTLYGVGSVNLFTINRSTGEATAVGPHGLGTGIQMGLAVDPDNGVMYMVYDQNLYSVNKLSGQASLIGPTGLDDIGSLAIVPGGNVPSAIPSTGALAQWVLILALLSAAFVFRVRLQEGRAE